jgi:hypothetical protein
MVVTVRLEGLNIVNARGRWYVYFRDGGLLLKGFEGTREALLARLGEPDLIGPYNARRKRDLNRVYAEGTLGALVAWFKTQCPTYADLSETTRGQYDDAFEYLKSEFDAPLDTITQPALYATRDTCVKQKWPSFADKMMVALSSMFTQAVKRGKMPSNPALGMDKAYKRDKNKNREWTPLEWLAVQHAPPHILTPMMLARYVGYRGQTISTMDWRAYQPDPAFGKCFRLKARKNDELTWLPAVPEIQTYLDGLTRTSTFIATRYNGKAWENELQMQSQVSHWLKEQERAGLLAPGATLHGLRATYASAKKRDGASDSEVAAALGDRTTRMGEHYTRHVEAEAKVIRAFTGKGRK